MASAKTVRYWLLPVLTLVLGWHLGVQFQMRQFGLRMQQIDNMVNPASLSGGMVTDPQRQVDISLVWSVWRALQNNYINPADLQPSKLVYGAAEGLVRSVGDPYTVFMTPKEKTDFQQVLNGKLQGIGAELEQKNGLTSVVAPLKGSPAEQAGLLPGDVIIDVDGTSIQTLTLNQVVEKIRGPKGTKVTLRLARPRKEPFELTIMRDDIRIPSVESSIRATKKGPLGYLILNQFGENSMAEVRQALDTFQKEKTPIKGIILDLRGNGGGYLESAVELVSLFIKEGKVVSVERRGKEIETHFASGNPVYPDLPLVVLVNQGSASASEITAGALQDYGRATLIGMPTFGKGTVQEVLDLPGGSSLRVTIAHWLTPKGKNLGKEKVIPDIQVDRTIEDYDAKKDPQLDAAELWLLEGKRPIKATGSGVTK